MTDREKVINGLKCIIDGTVRCESCGYSIDKHGHHSCQQNCASDALALLKEQEPVKAVADGEDYRCNNCGTVIGWPGWEPDGVVEVKDKFCPECGRPVKWE